MKSKETILILSEIANTLDKKSLFKEASNITNIMNRIVVSQDPAGDSRMHEDKPETSTSPDDTKPTADQEKQYQIAIQKLKNELFSGARTPQKIVDFVFAAKEDTNGFYNTFVKNNALTEKQYEAFKIQIKSILSRYTTTDAQETPKISRSTKMIDFIIGNLLKKYMEKNNLTIRDLTNDTQKSQIKSAILEKINSEQLFASQKDLLIQHLDRTLNSYKTAFIKKNIKIAQRQTNKYKAEDINIIEQNNGNFLDVHNLGKLYPNETFTAMQAQSLANRIYKKDKNLVDNNITFQVRHNDNNTLDIMVNIQDNL
jgi:hypothetical protein